jgi:hypothetical protein
MAGKTAAVGKVAVDKNIFLVLSKYFKDIMVGNCFNIPLSPKKY